MSVGGPTLAELWGAPSVTVAAFALQANLSFPGASAVLATEYCSIVQCGDSSDCSSVHPVVNVSFAAVSVVAQFTSGE